MLGPFSLLPLLDGWNYSVQVIPVTPLVKGPPQFLKKITGRGWVMGAFFVCTDAYATFRIRLHGTRGKWWELLGYPEMAFTLGAFQQDPAGWIQLYSRPNPLRTSGLYVFIPFSGGYQGTPMPFVPEVIIEGYLGDLSTETSALLTATADIIEIVDEEAFMESYHALMGTDLTAKAKLRLSEYLTKLKELQK